MGLRLVKWLQARGEGRVAEDGSFDRYLVFRYSTKICTDKFLKINVVPVMETLLKEV